MLHSWDGDGRCRRPGCKATADDMFRSYCKGKKEELPKKTFTRSTLPELNKVLGQFNIKI